MTPEEITHQFEKLLFSVQRSRRYHHYRQRYFNRLDFWAGFATTLMSASIFVLGVAQQRLPLLIVAGITAVGKLFVLAGQTTRRAVLHNGLYADFTALERDMTRAGEGITSEQLKDFMARRLEIEINEPPSLRVLDLMCHNEQVIAGGHDRDNLKKVSRWQRLLASIFDLNAHPVVTAGKASGGK